MGRQPVWTLAVVLGACLAAGALTSCSQAASRASTLWTNVPEAAAWAERFNASQKEWQVLVEYQEDPTALLATPGTKADLIIFRGAATTAVTERLESLDSLFDGGSLARSSFFQGILEAGHQGDHDRLLPLSFDLPVVIYCPARIPDLAGGSVTAQFLADADRLPATTAPGRIRWSFSPLWQDFSLSLALMGGVGFRAGFQGALTWDDRALAALRSRLDTWPSPGKAVEADFTRKYLSTTPALALRQGRILFYPSTLASFLAQPWQDRRDLDFRFLTDGPTVAASDALVWAGIPSSSQTRGAGEHFLSWLFRVETQETLLANARNEAPGEFGLAAGIPALAAPARTALAEAFPESRGRLPASDGVRFWPALPPGWTQLRSGSVLPWLQTAGAPGSQLRTAVDKQAAALARP